MRTHRLPQLALLAAVLLSPPALADIGDEVRCADQADDKARLACYDAAVAKLKSEGADQQARDFGKAPARSPEEEAVTDISGKLVGWSKDPLGRAIITLDNGQVWKIMEYKPLMVSTAGTTTVK